MLQMLAEGKVAKEIATALDISLYTVDAHRGRIMKKLGLQKLHRDRALRDAQGHRSVAAIWVRRTLQSPE